MCKTIQYNLIFLIMFIFVAVSIGQDAFDQTVVQIKALETKLEENRQRVEITREQGESEIAEFRKSHKLNAPKDMFESDPDYDARIHQLDALVEKRHDALREHYFEDMQRSVGKIRNQIARLYRRVFSTSAVTVTLGTYDANNEFFPITFEFENQRIEERFNIKKDDARNLYHNWDKVSKIGYLSIDPGYRRRLAMMKLVYRPILEEDVTWIFHEVYDLGNNNSVAFSPDGRYFATDATLRKVSTGKKVYELDGALRNFNAISFSPDGKYLATGDARNATLWEVSSGTKVWQRANTYSVNAFSLTDPRGRGRATRYTAFNAISFSPDGKYLATGDARNATLWEVSSGTKVWQRANTYSVNAFSLTDPRGRGRATHYAAFNAISFSPDGKYLATCSVFSNGGRNVYLWEVSSGNKIRSMKHGRCISFSPDGKYLVIGDSRNKLTFWEVNKGKKVREMEYGSNIYAVAFSLDGQFLAVGGVDTAITFYRIPEHITIETEIAKEKVIQTDSSVHNLAWAPGGNLISDGKKVYQTLLQPEIYEIEKSIKPVVPLRQQRRLDPPIDRDIPIAIRSNPDAVAVVIGIQDYLEPTVPSVKYAKRDARLVREYLIKTFGYDEHNILPRDPNQLMTVGNFKTLIRQQLRDYVKKNGTSDVFIYYAGHGVPSTETQEAFLVPYDFNPNVNVNVYNAYGLKDFYEDLLKIECRSLTIVLDTCFSGLTGDGQMLIRNISPVVLPKLEISNEVLLSHPKVVVLTSTSDDRVSNWYPEKRHSLFTYFLLRGLQGGADKNLDNRITVGELETYLLDENNGVPYWAKRLFSRSQTPQVHASDKSIVIVDVER